MVGPHMRAGSPVIRSIIVRTFLASSRRCGSGTRSMKSSTLTSVALVLSSAIGLPFLTGSAPPIGPAHRLTAVQRRDRRDQRVAVATIADALREIMRRILEGRAGAVGGYEPESHRTLPARAGQIDGDAVVAGLEPQIFELAKRLAAAG